MLMDIAIGFYLGGSFVMLFTMLSDDGRTQSETFSTMIASVLWPLTVLAVYIVRTNRFRNTWNEDSE